MWCACIEVTRQYKTLTSIFKGQKDTNVSEGKWNTPMEPSEHRTTSFSDALTATRLVTKVYKYKHNSSTLSRNTQKCKLTVWAVKPDTYWRNGSFDWAYTLRSNWDKIGPSYYTGVESASDRWACSVKYGDSSKQRHTVTPIWTKSNYNYDVLL